MFMPFVKLFQYLVKFLLIQMHIIASSPFLLFRLSNLIPAQIMCHSSILQIIAAFPFRNLSVFSLSNCTVKHISA